MNSDLRFSARLKSCESCNTPCELYLSQKIKIADPRLECPVGRWKKQVEERPLPSTTQLAFNFSKAVVAEGKSLLQKSPKVDEAEAARRISICEQCTTWFRPTDRRCSHSSCGCWIDRKVKWKSQHCPIGKW